MPRPRSIIRFEKLYLASFVLSLVGWATTWSILSARLSADPRTAGYGWLLPAAVVLGSAITLVLWYLAARRASVVAKWFVVVLTAVAVLRFVFNGPAIMRGLMTPGELALSIGTLALSVAAAACLFAEDARAWFGEDLHDIIEEDA